MTADAHPKSLLHDAIQEALNSPDISGIPVDAAPSGVLLLRWGLVAEFSIDSSKTGLARISNTAGDNDMTSWDQLGFFATAAIRASKGQ